MKLRRLPDDFRVDEQTDLTPSGGPFAFYRLVKRSIGTPEAVEAILRRWKLSRRRISYGGLKDRHAVTSQHLTVYQGPRRGLEQKSFSLHFLGHLPRPFLPSDIRGNRFHLAVRDLSREAASRMAAALETASRDGVPNYFDDQRFGSLGHSREFVARAWCLRDYERALWLALADANEHDRPDEREQKRLLREHWGDWRGCKSLLSRSPRRSIVTFLNDRPGDYRGALARVRADLRSLYVSAYQSALWNEMLATLLRRRCRADQLAEVRLDTGTVPFFHCLDADQRDRLTATSLPLPSARLNLEPGETADLVEEVVARQGMSLRQLRIHYPRDSFFSKGQRHAVFLPLDASHETGNDELYPGRSQLRLEFGLPRGSYATMLIKRLTLGAATVAASSPLVLP